MCRCLLTVASSGLSPLVDSALLLFVVFVVPVIWPRYLLEAISRRQRNLVYQDRIGQSPNADAEQG